MNSLSLKITLKPSDISGHFATSIFPLLTVSNVLHVHIFQLEVAAELKKKPVQQQNPAKRNASHAVPQQAIQSPPQETPPLQPPPSKRKKQKIISTGGGRAFNPKEKLYCICRTPYEDTK